MTTPIRILGLVVVLALAASIPGPAEADEQDRTVSEYTYRRLQKAQEALEAKKHGEAVDACNQVLSRRSISDYERALALQTRAYVYVDRNKLGDAATDLKAAADLKALPGQQQTELHFNIGQILLSMEKPAPAIAEFEIWRAETSSPTPDALYTVAVAYAQAERFEGALRYLDPAIRAKGSKAPKPWKELKLACLVQLKRWAPAIDVLIELVEDDFQNPVRWKQLSAVYGEAGRQAESVAVLEAMYWNDLLTDQPDIVLLARNLLASEVPMKAARILGESMRNGRVKKSAETLELLGTAYVSASQREEAVEPLLAAARMGKSGRLFKEVGQVLLELEQFGEAAKNLRRAIAAGDLRQPGQAYILLGVAEYRQGRTGLARASFAKAAEYPDSKQAARSWIGFINAGS